MVSNIFARIFQATLTGTTEFEFFYWPLFCLPTEEWRSRFQKPNCGKNYLLIFNTTIIQYRFMTWLVFNQNYLEL